MKSEVGSGFFGHDKETELWIGIGSRRGRNPKWQREHKDR